MMLPEVMAEGLGYDWMGNNPDLLAPADAKALEEGTWVRVSGEAECPTCGYPLRMHPKVQGCLWLIRGCKGLYKP